MGQTVVLDRSFRLLIPGRPSNDCVLPIKIGISRQSQKRKPVAFQGRGIQGDVHIPAVPTLIDPETAHISVNIRISDQLIALGEILGRILSRNAQDRLVLGQVDNIPLTGLAGAQESRQR